MQLEQPKWQVDSAVLKLHSRRCTCLEFHPTKAQSVSLLYSWKQVSGEQAPNEACGGMARRSHMGSSMRTSTVSHMQDNIVVSGDKKGQVAVWDHEKVHERTVYATMHRALTNNLRFLCAASDAACASASSDGHLKARPQLRVHNAL